MTRMQLTYAVGLAVGIYDSDGYRKSGSDDSNVIKLKTAIGSKQEVDPALWAKVDEILNWAKKLPNENSDYYQSVVRILTNERGEAYPEDLGIIASVPYAYDSWAAKKAEQAAKSQDFANPANALGRFVGMINERAEFRATIKKITWKESDFGKSGLIVMVTAEGDKITSWVSETASFWKTSPQIGDTITFAGTVAAHSVYNGERFTKVKRIKRTGEYTLEGI